MYPNHYRFSRTCLFTFMFYVPGCAQLCVCVFVCVWVGACVRVMQTEPLTRQPRWEMLEGDDSLVFFVRSKTISGKTGSRKKSWKESKTWPQDMRVREFKWKPENIHFKMASLQFLLWEPPKWFWKLKKVFCLKAFGFQQDLNGQTMWCTKGCTPFVFQLNRN